MVRAWRSADVATCRAVTNPAWCRIFRGISCFSPLNHETLLRCSVLGQGTSLRFSWLRWKWIPGRTEMAMCTISSMRQNGCRTVCSPWNWNGTRLNRSSDQGVKYKSDDRSSDLISDYKPLPLPLYNDVAPKLYKCYTNVCVSWEGVRTPYCLAISFKSPLNSLE